MNFIPQAIGAGIGFVKGGGLNAVFSPANAGDISGGMSVLSALSTFSAGMADKREMEAQAARETLGATQEIIRGRQEENEILDRMVSTLANNRVAMAAAGSGGNFGTPAAIMRDQVQRGERAGRLARENAATEWWSRRSTASAYRARGQAYGLGAVFGAGREVLGGFVEAAKRGKP